MRGLRCFYDFLDYGDNLIGVGPCFPFVGHKDAKLSPQPVRETVFYCVGM